MVYYRNKYYNKINEARHYSHIVECIYFQEAKNAERAPMLEKIGINNQAIERKRLEKSDKKGRKSTNNDWERISVITHKNVTIEIQVAIPA